MDKQDINFSSSLPSGGGEDKSEDVTVSCKDFSPKTWLETLPSDTGTVLAAILANIMTKGLSSTQKNILGNFISALGTLISYKAAREDIDDD